MPRQSIHKQIHKVRVEFDDNILSDSTKYSFYTAIIHGFNKIQTTQHMVTPALKQEAVLGISYCDCTLNGVMK